MAYFYPLSYFMAFFRHEVTDTERYAKYTEYTGLTLIAVSLIIVSDKDGWPNLWSVLPLSGAYLCIAADNKHTVLGNTIIQKLGLWSYSLYLVHWPVIVLFSAIFPDSIWLMSILIFVLGITLHYTIEQRRNFGWKFLIVYSLIAGGVQTVIKTQASFIRDVPTIDFPDVSMYRNDKEQIVYDSGNTEEPAVLILTGDSFSRTIIPSLAKYFGDRHIRYVTYDRCLSSAGIYTSYTQAEDDVIKRCRSRFEHLKNSADLYPDAPIIWMQNWSIFDNQDNFIIDRQSGQVINNKPVELAIPQDVIKTASLFDNGKRKTYIIGTNRRTVGNSDNVISNYGQICYTWKRLDNIISNALFRNKCREKTELKDVRLNSELRAAVTLYNEKEDSNIIYIDPSEALCEGYLCRLLSDEGNAVPVFFDGSHLSDYGADIVTEFIIQQTGIR